MLELTLNEQKQINGGTYRVNVFLNDGTAVTSGVFSTWEQAQRFASRYSSSKYKTQIIY